MWKDMKAFRGGEGPTKNGGWVKWANNKDLEELRDDVMDIIDDVKDLMKTKEYKKNEQLKWATLAEPHPAKMWEYYQKDRQFKGLAGLKKKFAACARRMRMQSRKCPVAQKLRMQMMRLGRIIKRAEMNRKVTNPPDFSDSDSDDLE
jgi:hypothetical protein